MKKQFHLGKLGNNYNYLLNNFEILIVQPQTINIQVDGSQMQLLIKSMAEWSVPKASTGSVIWDDSNERIYFSQISGEKENIINVSSDENFGHRRSKDIEIVGIDNKGKAQRKFITVYQYGVYDGKNPTTPDSEYVDGLDGGGVR